MNTRQVDITSQGIAVHQMVVTPDLAGEWLKRNLGNRPLNPSHVKFLSKVIESGEFELTHQGIAFDENGDLLDGQHRLTAIVKSGVSVPMMVHFNVPRATFKIIDGHIRVRTMAERLRESPTAVSIVTLIHRTTKAGWSRPRNSTIETMLEVFREPLSSLQQLANWRRRAITGSIPVKSAMTLALIDQPSRSEYLLRNMQALLSSDLQSLSVPFLTLYRTLREPSSHRTRSIVQGGTILQIDSLIRSWIAMTAEPDDPKRIVIKNPDYLLNTQIRPAIERAALRKCLSIPQ